MTENLISRLGARALMDTQQSDYTTDDFEKLIGFSLPKELSTLLKDIGGAVFFDRGAKFSPSELSGREDADGYRTLEVLYGGSCGINSLAERHSMLKNELPAGLIAIGELSGGDQICIQKHSPTVLLWKHDVDPDDAITEVEKDAAKFLNALEPDSGNGVNSVRGVIEEESYLDF